MSTAGCSKGSGNGPSDGVGGAAPRPDRRRVRHRPEAIKCAPSVKVIDAHPAHEACVIVTGQHTTIIDEVHETFGITADYGFQAARI